MGDATILDPSAPLVTIEKVTRIPLSPLDNVMAHCYAKFVLCFSLKDGQDFQSVHSILQQGLSRTIAQMPIFGGTVGFRPSCSENWKPGQLEVQYIEKVGEEGNFPLIFNDLSAEMDFDDLKDAGFPEEDLNGRVLLTKAFNLNLAGGLDAIVAQANFVKDGCLLGLGIWHTVSDGYGAYNFARRWAENCKIMQSSSQLRTQVQIIAESTNRELLAMVWPIEEFKAKSGEETDRLWRFLGLNPMNEKGELKIPAKPTSPQTSPPKAAPVMRTCIFYVSASSFEELKRAATPRENDIRITANDAVNALCWRCIMSARYPPDRTSTSSDEESQFNMALDGRVYSPKLPSTYLGNVVIFASATLPIPTLTSPTTPLSFLALTIRQSLNAYTNAEMGGAFAIASSIADYTSLSYTFAGLDGAKMNISSNLNVPLFELDFGSDIFGNGGHPESIRIPKDELDGVFRRCLTLPLRPHGGFEILISLFEEEMRRLREDKEFARYAKFSCY